MRWFCLSDDVEVVGRWRLGRTFEAGEEIDPRVFTSVTPYPRGRPLTCEIEHPGDPLDFTFGHYDVPVVTMELADALRAHCGESIELHPVRLIGGDEYMIANVLEEVECVNEAASSFEKFDEMSARPDRAGEYSWMTRLVLDERRAARGGALFRVKGWRIALIADEDLARTFRARGWSGVRLAEV